MLGEWAARPTIRARDIDRDYAMGLLRDASVDGQLTSQEFEQRLRQAMHARTLGELAGLVGDLQGERTAPPASSPAVQAPQVHQPVARVHAPKRNGGGRIVALSVLGGLLLLGSNVGIFGLGESGSDEGMAVEAGGFSGLCMEDPSGAIDGDCVEGSGLLTQSAGAATELKELGLPSDLPIPHEAAFTGRNWASADNGAATDKTTYRWHLEYRLDDQPVGTQDLLDFYRSSVPQETFGFEAEEQQIGADVTEVRWASALDEPKAAGYTLVVRSVEDGTGVRVELEVATSGPALSRPDVPGDLGAALQAQGVKPGEGMTYLRSKASQVAGTPSSCALEQVWMSTKTGQERVFSDSLANCPALVL